MALKGFFMTKIAGVKTAVAQYTGSNIANLAAGTIAAGATAAYWEMKFNDASDRTAIDAAVAKGMTTDAARGIVRWLRDGYV